MADQNMFSGTRSVVDITKYMLMRGVTDFGDLAQFNLYESGYSFLVVVEIPKFLSKQTNSEYQTIIKNYAHILEFENRGISGVENITVDQGQLTNGINQINIINKVNKPSDTTFTAQYQEKLGSTITKAHELFLTGIKDPRTQVKTYLGLINSSSTSLTPGYENEIFKFMYIVCDNTLTKMEKAIYITSAQLSNAPLDIYNSEKGTYEFKEISVEFSGFPIMSRQVNTEAEKFRNTIFTNTIWQESEKKYKLGTDKTNNTITMYNTMNTDKNYKETAYNG